MAWPRKRWNGAALFIAADRNFRSSTLPLVCYYGDKICVPASKIKPFLFHASKTLLPLEYTRNLQFRPFHFLCNYETPGNPGRFMIRTGRCSRPTKSHAKTPSNLARVPASSSTRRRLSPHRARALAQKPRRDMGHDARSLLLFRH